MTKVTIIKSRLSFSGGLEKSTLAIAKAFVAKGCEVTLLTTGENNPQINGVKVISLGHPPRWSYLAIHFFDRACKQWLKAHPSDLVFGLDRTLGTTHYRAGNGAHKIFLTRKKCSRLKSWFWLINPKDLLILKLEKQIFQNPNLKVLFTNSSMVKNELLKAYKIDPKKIKVVFNGIDLERFNWTPSSKSLALKQLHLNPKLTQFLFIGNGYKRKGLHFLLKALSLLPELSFQLSVVGKEKYISSYESYARSLGLEEKVCFFGPQSDLIPFYQAADCFVFPTTYDPFAGVTLEALAMGLFVITSPYNGAKEIIQKGCGKILNNLEDPTLFAKLLRNFIEKKISKETPSQIRESIKTYHSQNQLNKIVEYSLKHV